MPVAYSALLGAFVESYCTFSRLVWQRVKQVMPLLYVGVPVNGVSVLQGVVVATCQ